MVKPGVARYVVAGAGIIVATILVLAWLGQPWICNCGYVKFWHGVTISSENSQQISDWYTPSHILHGIIFYFFLWLLARHWPMRVRVLIALLIECAWEIVENTPFIIERYREATISLDYFGDSIVNSFADILAMLVGFWLAARAPVWLSIATVVLLELLIGYAIRDNLTLNIIMLVYPLDVIRDWQVGG